MNESLIEVQPLLWPKPGICTDETMYFRRDPAKTSFSLGRDAIVFELNGTACFDTYFNSFSASKWNAHTVPAELFLKLRFRGRFQVRLLGYQYRNGTVIPYTFDALDMGSDDDDEAVFHFVQRQECILCGFCLIAMRENSVFLGGAYCKEMRPELLPEVTLALNICTYHREPYVLETLDRLKNALDRGAFASLREHVRVYITDNGQTLSGVAPQLPWVKIIPQNGHGSAGGFARGQLEIQRDADSYGITHMIFMDDDISLDPRALLRAYWFLRFIKKEFDDYVLGGELLRLHFPESQVEAGARWNGGKIASTKPNLDLRRLDHILFNEIPERVDYQGWWFCCVPLRMGARLPMPVYFHRDDVEFGLRCKGFIYLNGICVWHNEFENKPSPSNAYYDTRNRYIVNSIHCPWYGGKAAAKDLMKDAVKKILTQRYSEAELVLRAARDFCRGAEWVTEKDGPAFYGEIVGSESKPVPLADCESGMSFADYERNLFHAPSNSKKAKAKCWLMGFLQPAKYVRTVPMFMPSPDCFYRAKKVFHYDSSSESVLVTEKDMSRAIGLLARLAVGSLRLAKNFPNMAEQWRAQAEYYTSDEYWENKLKN